MKKANQFTRVGTFCEKCRQVICICKPEINPPMQKKLITDQLIEEYQKELDALIPPMYSTMPGSDWATRKEMLTKLITRLQSLRQQEVQNVKDAHEASDKQYYGNGNDYFTQTFEQKGGEKK